jgi:hypothetical protein
LAIAQRKNTKTNIDSLDRILNLLNWKKDVFLNESSEKSYDKVVGYVESVMTKLKEKVESLPIGPDTQGHSTLKSRIRYRVKV